MTQPYAEYSDTEKANGKRNAQVLLIQKGAEATYEWVSQQADAAEARISSSPAYWGAYYAVLRDKLDGMENPAP